jgi:hypothetical protein
MGLKTIQKKILNVFIVLFFSFFSITQYTSAQSFELYSENDVFVEVNPKIPGPNENVQLGVTSYSFNLNNYLIAWFKDGERQNSGFGERNFNFTTGPSGSITNIVVIIEYENQIFRKELQFSPSEADLLWEVIDGYAPPFYRGKVLPISQSSIRVTAIPETLLIEPTDAPNLVYYWDRNYKRQGSKSGFGKSFFDFVIGPITISEKITVTTNDRRENSFASNTIDIPTDEFVPRILFYEIDNLGRLLTHKALNTHRVINKDILRFSFHPLFMSTVRPNFVDLFVNWIINDSSQEPQDFTKQNELYLSSDDKSGSALITVELEGIEKLLQQTKTSFELVFSVPKK